MECRSLIIQYADVQIDVHDIRASARREARSAEIGDERFADQARRPLIWKMDQARFIRDRIVELLKTPHFLIAKPEAPLAFGLSAEGMNKPNEEAECLCGA